MDISIFKGKKILITGAGKGIGRDLVKTLAKSGAIIYGLSRTESDLISLKEECPSISTITCDLANWKGTEEALKDVPPLDHLVNNAGVAIRGEFFNMKEDEVDLMFNVNVKAVLNVTRLVSKKMVDAKIQGSIVNVSSLASVKQVQGLIAYAVTKSAVDKVTKCTALELAPYKIRVNSVNPTIVLTQMGQETWKGMMDEAMKYIPFGKFAEESHCTNAILVLLSDLSAMTTGGFFFVDGGGTLL